MAKPAFVVPMPHRDVGWGSRVWIDAKNNVISVGHVADSVKSDIRYVKHFFTDSAGHVGQVVTEPPQSEDVAQPIQFTTTEGPKVITRYLYEPFGARELRANGPDGEFALAGGGKYSVRWFSRSGELLRTITREFVGLALSVQDRAAGDSQLVAVAKNAHTTVAMLPFKLPERKPPLYNIFFDADGRLWVQHPTLKGLVQTADVYGADGSLAFHAAWPAGIGIANNGDVRGNTAWGVQLDDNDVPHIVRMEFTGGR